MELVTSEIYKKMYKDPQSLLAPLKHADTLSYHFLVVVKILYGLLGTADLVVVPLGGYVEIVERQRPKGREESTVDVIPYPTGVEESSCFNQRIHNLLTSGKVAGLRGREGGREGGKRGERKCLHFG